MTTIQFYHLPENMGSLFPVLVNLMEMSLENGLDTLIHCTGEPQARTLYGYLEQRFQLGADFSLAEAPASRHSLCWTPEPGHHHGMLINLTDSHLPWFSRFDFLAEIIRGDEQLVEKKREHYRLYRHRGYPLQYHDLTGAGVLQTDLL